MASILELFLILLLSKTVITLNHEFIRETNNVLVPSNDINLNEKIKQIDNGKTLDDNDLLMNDKDLFALGEILPKDKYMKVLQNYKNINHMMHDNQNNNNTLDQNDMANKSDNTLVDKKYHKYIPETTTSISSSNDNFTSSTNSVESTTSKNGSESLNDENDRDIIDNKKKECVLKTSKFYLKWVASNGKLIVKNIGKN
jgi:hypothetical protein